MQYIPVGHQVVEAKVLRVELEVVPVAEVIQKLPLPQICSCLFKSTS